MSINYSQLHDQTHQFSDGEVSINTAFTANILSVQCDVKPEYQTSQQTIGYLYQYSGIASKNYAIKSGNDVINLAIPTTDKLIFIPTNFLNDSYRLILNYALVGNIDTANQSEPIPPLILELPSRVSALELKPSTSDWNTIQNKPTNFSPSVHGHVIGNIIGLADALASFPLRSELPSITGLVSESELTAKLSDYTKTVDLPVSSNGSQKFTLITSNTELESNKLYLSNPANLIHTLPASPSIGDVVTVGTGNFITKVYQNSSQTILNQSTQTPIGADTGLILKPYSLVKLVYVESGLWVVFGKSRTVNNWLPISIESTSVQKVYTPSFFNTVSPAYGCVIGNIKNGVILTGDYVNNGLLADQSLVQILLTFDSLIKIETFDFYGGQGNIGFGSANDNYKVDQINVFSGNNLSNLLGTFSTTNINAAKQSFNVDTSGMAFNQYLFSFSRTGNGIGILELVINGKAQVGGEIMVV